MAEMPASCGSYEQWDDALTDVIEGRGANCPCCAADQLRLVVDAVHPSGRATVSFWCDRCLWGLMPNAVAADRVTRFAGSDHDKVVPDYRIVQPD
jgi:hypothetical protein